jgi:hypothetical protein
LPSTHNKRSRRDIFLLEEKRGLEVEEERESGSDPQSPDLWPCFISFVFNSNTQQQRNGT